MLQIDTAISLEDELATTRIWYLTSDKSIEAALVYKQAGEFVFESQVDIRLLDSSNLASASLSLWNSKVFIVEGGSIGVMDSCPSGHYVSYSETGVSTCQECSSGQFSLGFQSAC